MRAADFPFFDARFLAFAHRGGAAYGPNLHRENTVHAFDTAVSMGYRYLETDVHATVDGVLLAFHDDRLDRVTDSSGQIAQLKWTDVARARIGDRDAIPRLADLLERYPEVRFNIDAKSDAAVGLLATTIADHDAYDRVCVSSFSTARLHRLRRELGPRVPSAASARGVAWNRFVPALARLVNTPAVALQIPVDHAVRGRRVRVLTPGLLRAAHRAGKQVHVWTIDDAQQMTDLIDGGVDGIFTDRVDTLRTVLEQRGLWG